MQFDVITLFPEMFSAITASGISRRARENGAWHLALWNPRDFTENAYRTVDDRPYGGGPGMVMLAEPLDRAIAAALARQQATGVEHPRLIYLSPQGSRLDHRRVMALKEAGGVVLLAGRYEGIDERLLAHRQIEELSIGDYVLSGGELAAMVVMDCVIRQLPDALGGAGSVEQESFVNGLLDYPQYTRPEEWKGMRVPEVLLSGHHREVERWRRAVSLRRTAQRRPDLLDPAGLSREDREALAELGIY